MIRKLLIMRFTKLCLPILSSGSILVMLLSCSKEEDKQVLENPKVNTKGFPDLNEAIQKRVENKPKEAIELLRKHNAEYPDSPKILVQLARALVESKQYSLAAFRLDQAISLGAPEDLLLESGQAYIKAGDFDSAEQRYLKYLDAFPKNNEVRVSLARILAKNGKDTASLNAFEQSIGFTNADDCLVVGNLYLKKKIYVKAEHWFKESARLESTFSVAPLVGLLRMNFERGNNDNVETLLLDIEKSFPNSLNNLNENKSYSDFIKQRRMEEFNKRGIIIQNLSTSELIQELLNETKNIIEPVVSNGPKLAPLISENKDFEQTNTNKTIIVQEEEKSSLSLAEAFSKNEAELISPSPLELGWSSFLIGDYKSAIVHSRNAIRLNDKDSEAWRLSSQSHFQLGETREAEMTILEAIRHNPNDLQTRVDYLNISRETLSSSRYLRELEKTHEKFPDSGEILWQLARRYHLVERMPVTAGILYRKLLRIIPKESGLYNQAEMELIKIESQ